MSDLLNAIKKTLESGDLTQSLPRLFLEVLHWGNPQGFQEQVLSIKIPVKGDIIAKPIAQMSGLPVYMIQWPENRLPTVTARRSVHRALSKIQVEHLLCYVSQDGEQVAFVWARRLKARNRKVELRTLPYHVGTPARTTIERLSKLQFSLNELGTWRDVPITTLMDKLNTAFDVQAVTKKFFEDYKKIFEEVQRVLYKQHQDKVWAHDFALQFLNRLMFLYFIQRKRFSDGEYWLGNDPNFIRNFWETYKRSGQPSDTFYQNWLSVLFFEAFNNKFQAGRKDREYFPENIRDALAGAPLLNGGLFSKNNLDRILDQRNTQIPDSIFEKLFDSFNDSTPGFFERYNFTVSETTPFDIEVAVDPEMIGKVYESLVNITFEGLTEEDLRGTAGIFYTPRVEIDLMCRLALVDTLANYLGQQYKPLLYEAVFAYDEESKETADQKIVNENLWLRLNEVLRQITVCDPACGSGSFLVGMLLVLDDLQSRANEQLGIEESPYDRRRRIIGEQLYGVDVMEWAVHVAELRLWLQLTVETDIHKAEAHLKPLLPNLSFKVRPGDSLVQEFGGINLGLHRDPKEIPSYLKGKITRLKAKKLRFYQGDTSLNEISLRREELSLFHEILNAKKLELENKKVRLNRKIKDSLSQIEEMPGMEQHDLKTENFATKTTVQQFTAQKNEIETELKRIRNALDVLRPESQIPFVWDIAFVEIFEGEKRGFDIVIGNPPYVRQEKIDDPSPIRRYSKEEYKKKLHESVWWLFPGFNPGHRINRKNPHHKLDGRSDLYVFFYFHGLSLLNSKGSFCFITSNSWLDVGYGKHLQEFLLRHGHIKMIIDNRAKRSFSQADVNTIIALLGPPSSKPLPERELSSHHARFVSFRVPFEEVLDPVIFYEIEDSSEYKGMVNFRVLKRPEFRSVLWNQKALFEDGIESVDGDLIDAKASIYIGNKWGGKYLRAPDIFFTILEKGREKLISLGEIADIETYLNTGGADGFFIVKDAGGDDTVRLIRNVSREGQGRVFDLETKFLRPFVKSPSEIHRITILPSDPQWLLVVLPLDEKALTERARRYIRWGELVGFHKRSGCRNRRPWWKLPRQATAPAPCLFFRGYNDRLFSAWNPNLISYTRAYGVWFTIDEKLGVAMLNTTFVILQREMLGRTNLGQGALDFQGVDIPRIYVINPDYLMPHQVKSLLSAFDRLARHPIRSIFEELGFPLCRQHRCSHPEHPYEHVDPQVLTLEQVRRASPDRFALDEVVFDALGLTDEERLEVYQAVAELVKNRLVKARSV